MLVWAKGDYMNKLKELINKYKHVWIVVVYFIFYLPWYFGIQQRDPSRFFDMHVTLDSMISFKPIFIFAYIYWFIFVAATFLFVFFYDKDEFYKCCAFMFGGMTICLIIFTFFPTTFDYRPAVISGNYLERFFLNIVYTADKPTNVFPSIHVLNSIGCAIVLIKSKYFKNNYFVYAFAIMSAVIITLSTMFVKQHSIMDALAAGIISVILYYLVYVVFDGYLKREHHES